MGYREIFNQYRKLADTTTVKVTPADVENYKNLLKGGFSYNHATGQNPKTGYMVGLSREHGGVAHTFNLSELNPNKLAEHRQAMEAAGHDGADAYQGGWVEGDKVYLDVSHNLHDRAEAIRQGQKHNQKAIYHIDSGEDIPTGGTGE